MQTLMRVADYVANFIKSEGVDTVFLVPGGGAMFLDDALGLVSGLNYVANHNEQASSICAEAYSRVTENIGVAVVTTGPGATNAITGVAGAWIESVPLVVISGQVKRADMKGATGVRQMGPQEVDIVSMVKSITKYAVTIMDPLDIRYELEKAFHLAKSGRKGPVWIDVPLDIQAAPITPSQLRSYQVDSADKKPSTVNQNVLDLVLKAERPLILAGHGIRLSGGAEVFKKLYEAMGIPIVATWNAMDLIPANHRLSVGKPGTVALRPANFAVQNCDLLISIGARLDNVVTAYNPGNFARNAKKVVVDIDSAELGKFTHAIDLKIQSDAQDFCKELYRSVADNESLVKQKSLTWAPWIDKCNHWKAKYPINDGQPFPSSGEISHFHMVNAFADLFPEDSLIVTGSSGLGVESFYTAFRNKPGQRVFLTSGLGAMGYGVPAIIGALCANKIYKRVIGVESDGSLQMNLQELLTLKALNKPATIFIINNKGYASIRNTQRNYFNSRYLGTGPEAKLFLPDISRLAASIDIPTIKIESVENLHQGINQALNYHGLILCDIHVSPNEALWPKSAALPQPDGSMLSMPLEDMSPLLSRDELRAEMLVDLDPASLSIKN